jgi:uncharacterized protein YegL
MESFERRLPVYLLLDTSESMLDEGIEALQKGLSTLMMDLHGDPHALETVWISVITFADRAEQVVPLTELGRVRIPPLRCRPGTALGGALSLLQECVRREVRTHSAEVKGDWKPMVFLLTDGTPTDDWEPVAARLRASAGTRPMNLIAIGCGDDVDPYVLMQVSSNVLMMQDRPESFRSLFQWISASLSVTSQAVASPTPGPVSLEKLPDELRPAAAADRPRAKTGLQPHLFLPARCSRTRKPYLIRYHLNDEHRVYEPVRTHRVDEEYFAGGSAETSLSVSTSQLAGILPCPHCRADGAGRCECGQLMCATDEMGPVDCPGCDEKVSFGGPSRDSFDLSGRMG